MNERSPETLPVDCTEQKAIVKEVLGNEVEVTFTATSACGQCSSRSNCIAAEHSEKTAFIKTNLSLAPGEEVLIGIRQSLGWRAVFLGFLLPLMLILLVLFSAFGLGLTQGLSALLGLASLIPYYLVLYLSKSRLERKFSLTVRKLSND